MAKKCIYCSAEVSANSVVDMCQRCMYQVWGEKMAEAIIKNMEGERDKGNLHQSDLKSNEDEDKTPKRKIENVPELREATSPIDENLGIENIEESPTERNLF